MIQREICFMYLWRGCNKEKGDFFGHWYFITFLTIFKQCSKNHLVIVKNLSAAHIFFTCQDDFLNDHWFSCPGLR